MRAPFAGIVVKKMTEVGESVAPIPPGVNISTSSGAIVAIADMNSLEAEVDVNESNVAQLQSGQPAEITVQAIPDKTYKGVLAAGDSHRRPHQGDRDGKDCHPRQGQESEAGDELQRDFPCSRQNRGTEECARRSAS